MASAGGDGTTRLTWEADVPEVGEARTFRHSRVRASLAAAAIVAGSAALLAVGRMRHAPLAYYVAAVALLLLAALRDLVLARLRPTNWLVRVADDGLYVKFRSYLNYQMSAQDWTVLFVPFRTIRSARILRETQEVPNVGERSGTTRRRRVLVDIDLREDAPEIADALATERGREGPRVRRWYGTSSSRWRHYPVRMPSPRRLEIEWGGVAPSAASLLSVLAAHGADVEVRDVTTDYSRLAALTPAQQEGKLRELAEQGEVIEAAQIARRLYGYDYGRAKRYVEALAVGKVRAESARDA